jgi:hypothetical protein
VTIGRFLYVAVWFFLVACEPSHEQRAASKARFLQYLDQLDIADAPYSCRPWGGNVPDIICAVKQPNGTLVEITCGRTKCRFY